MKMKMKTWQYNNVYVEFGQAENIYLYQPQLSKRKCPK